MPEGEVMDAKQGKHLVVVEEKVVYDSFGDRRHRYLVTVSRPDCKFRGWRPSEYHNMVHAPYVAECKDEDLAADQVEEFKEQLVEEEDVDPGDIEEHWL